MRVYVATRFGDWFLADCARQLLAAAGHECSSRWIDVARDLEGRCDAVPVATDERRAHAVADLRDLYRSDAMLLLVPADGGTGMWVELGVAIAAHKRIVCMGPALERTLFCELPNVEVYSTISDAIEALGDA